jgi:hypothetical protein
MALLFTGSNGLTAGTGSSMANVYPHTAIAWIYMPVVPTSQTNFVAKVTGSSNWAVMIIRNTGPQGSLSHNRPNFPGPRSTGSLGVITANTWWCVATLTEPTSSVSPAYSGYRGRLYMGTLDTPMYETEYGPVGVLSSSGLPSDDTNGPLTFSYPNNIASAGVMQIRMSHVALFNRPLSLAEMRQWQYNPRPMDGCVGFWQFGKTGDGTSNVQPDYSGKGNNARLTGSTVPLAVNPIPLGYPLFR